MVTGQAPVILELSRHQGGEPREAFRRSGRGRIFTMCASMYSKCASKIRSTQKKTKKTCFFACGETGTRTIFACGEKGPAHLFFSFGEKRCGTEKSLSLRQVVKKKRRLTTKSCASATFHHPFSMFRPDKYHHVNNVLHASPVEWSSSR